MLTALLLWLLSLAAWLRGCVAPLLNRKDAPALSFT